MTKPLTPAQIKARKKARLLASLTPRKQNDFNAPIKGGPLNVRRATGINASI